MIANLASFIRQSHHNDQSSRRGHRSPNISVMELHTIFLLHLSYYISSNLLSFKRIDLATDGAQRVTNGAGRILAPNFNFFSLIPSSIMWQASIMIILSRNHKVLQFATSSCCRKQHFRSYPHAFNPKKSLCMTNEKHSMISLVKQLNTVQCISATGSPTIN